MILDIDIDTREHNRIASEEHPMFSRIQMIQGSSISLEIIDQVMGVTKDYKCILVCFDLKLLNIVAPPGYLRRTH